MYGKQFGYSDTNSFLLNYKRSLKLGKKLQTKPHKTNENVLVGYSTEGGKQGLLENTQIMVLNLEIL